MKFTHFLKEHRDETISYALNIGGTALIIAGIITLPIYFSYRLLVGGAFCLVLWKTYTN